jgi:hypothetical protein
MNLIKIAEEVYVDPDDVVSIEHDVVNEYVGMSPSDSTMKEKFNGSRLTLKNGRKVFVNYVMPSEILLILGRREGTAEK